LASRLDQLRIGDCGLRIGGFAAAVLLVSCAPPPSVEPDVAWRAFRGEFRSVSNGVETKGRYWRHRDGSARRETLGADGKAEFITIESLSASQFYSFSAGSWTAQPLRLPATRTLPPTGTAFPNATPQTERVAGYRVVGAYTVLGTLMLRAPALDYFPLVEDHPHPALRVEFVSIVEEPVGDTLFLPPPGAEVATLPWPYTGL
jgi:hypothetical protein